MESQLVNAVGFSKRMSRVDVEESTTVGPELFDRLHEADWAQSDGLGDAIERIVDSGRAGKGVDRSLAHEDEAAHEWRSARST